MEGTYALITEKDVLVRASYCLAQGGGSGETTDIPVEITDESEYLTSDEVYGTYDEEIGWTPESQVFDGDARFFAVDVPAGMCLYLVFSEEVDYVIYPFGSLLTLEGTAKALMLEGGDTYGIAVLNSVTLRAYIGSAAPTELTDESDILEPLPPSEGEPLDTYDAEEGAWKGVSLTSDQRGPYIYFLVNLKPGDLLMLEFSEPTQFDVLAFGTGLPVFEDATDRVIFVAQEAGSYFVVTAEDVYVRAYYDVGDRSFDLPEDSGK
jgi:hypothetical protein